MQLDLTPEMMSTIDFWNNVSSSSGGTRWPEIWLPSTRPILPWPYAYPDEEEFLEEMAKQQKGARLRAWANFPSDIAAGDELGRQVAYIVIEHARTDDSDLQGNATIPDGPGYWKGEGPLRPLWGKVRPWTTNNISQFRPSPPPSVDLEEFKDALQEVRAVSDNRTEEQL